MRREDLAEFVSTVLTSVGILACVITTVFFTIGHHIEGNLVKNETERFVDFITVTYLSSMPINIRDSFIDKVKEQRTKNISDEGLKKADAEVELRNKALFNKALGWSIYMLSGALTISFLLWRFVYQFPIIPYIMNVIFGGAIIACVEILIMKFLLGENMPLDIYHVMHEILIFAQKQSRLVPDKIQQSIPPEAQPIIQSVVNTYGGNVTYV